MKRTRRLELAAASFALLLLAGCGSDSNTLVDSNQNGDDQTDQSNGSGNTDTDSGGNGDNATDDNGTGDNGTGDNATGDNATGDGTGNFDNNTAEVEAVYRATFNATWSTDTHSTNFPGNPHFSPLTGAVHSEQTVLWEFGQIASAGIEEMAETGGTATLLSEIQFAIDEGRALAAINGGGIALSPGSTSVEFTINRDHSGVSLVSMLAPSPDWYVGINSQPLIDQNGDFIQSLTVDLQLYDSGTDSGLRFDSADEDTQPQSPVDFVNSDSSDTNFVDGRPYVGQLIIERIR